MRPATAHSPWSCGIQCVMSFDINNLRVGVIGLGYVGLPLAVEFGKQYPTLGFDLNPDRIAELEKGVDSTWRRPKKS